MLSLALSSLANASVQTYFDQIKHNPKALTSFFQTMPKGGELHYHLAGGAYPEAMIDLLRGYDYCLNSQTATVLPLNPDCQKVQKSDLNTDSPLYHQLISAWSMQDFDHRESGHDHFFHAFGKFLPLVFDHRPALLVDIMQRAAQQHELYLEIMEIPDNAASTQFDNLVQSAASDEEKQAILLKNHDFQTNIQHTVDETANMLTEARQLLNCEQNPDQEVCRLTIRFQYYVLREQSPNKVFAQALNGFEAAKRSNLIVGVNLVQPEDGPISLRDYQEQMSIFHYLHQQYPQVHVSLHAGEITPALANTQDLRFHIREAILTGNAERIGHGVDIRGEDQAENTLKIMARKPVPVEINLTSNKTILEVSGKDHPLRTYLAHQVPVVLSTDDEGILRTNLTEQYVQAVTEQGLEYDTLKQINRNSLSYSFMPGKSLWLDVRGAVPVKACANLKSRSCLTFIQQNPKANLQWQLENQLAAFEGQYR